jgi:multidrug efflux pump subunit AcrA (membrane-fusion protein)
VHERNDVMKKVIPLTIFMFLLGVSLSACGGSAQAAAQPSATVPAVTDSSEIIAEGRVEPIRYGDIAFNASGVVSKVLVKEGEAVQKGQQLIQLGDELDTNYAAAQLELATAQQALNDLKNTSGEDLAQVVIDLKDAKEEYDKADDYLRYLQNSRKVPQTENRLFLIQTWKGYEYRSKTKYFKGPAPEDWIIEARNDLALKKAKMEDLQRSYDHKKDGVDDDQLALLEARLNAAKARVASLEVTAPFDGVVAKLNAKVGSSINAGEIAVSVADFSSWLIKTTDLTEIDVVKVTGGQPVQVTLDALPDITLNGSVLSIGQSYSENQGDIVYEVTILLQDKNPTMRWGMTAEVKFINDDE